MGQGSLEEFRAKIRDQIQKEIEQENKEALAQIYLENTDYDDETIAEKVGLDIQKVCQFRRNYEKWLYAQKLEISTEPKIITSELPSHCLPSDMYVRNGKFDGVENMLMLSLHSIGLRRFLEIISNDTKQKLQKMLEEQGLD